MPKISRFEELQSWQKARELVNVIYDLTYSRDFVKDNNLKNQIQRAAGSVMHNIAEGFESGSGAEFVRFLKIARRSASEVQSELYLALDRCYIKEIDRSLAHERAEEIKRLINGLIAYLKK